MRVLRMPVICVLGALAFAAGMAEVSGRSTYPKRLSNQEESRPAARKFREFNPAETIEAKVHYDFFNEELLQQPNAQAYIIFYRGRWRSSWQDHVYAKKYLDNRGDISPGRIKAIFGGYRQDTAMELWIVPEGADLPKPTPTYFPKKRRRR